LRLSSLSELSCFLSANYGKIGYLQSSQIAHFKGFYPLFYIFASPTKKGKKGRFSATIWEDSGAREPEPEGKRKEGEGNI
jgi:hypothetical protein